MKKMIAVAALTILTSGALYAAPETYHFGVSQQRTNITFESETDFETVLGVSNQAKGTLEADLEKGNAKIEVEVPVASLRTGIDLRDEHLRSPMWLDADKYPTIAFSSSSARRISRNQWEITGQFTMHGVTREITVTADVRAIPEKAAKSAGLEGGSWLRVSVPFDVSLADYGVKIPKMAAAKVDDTWKVRFLVYASTSS